MKEYRRENSKKITEDNREYYDKNKIRRLEFGSKWRTENRDKVNYYTAKRKAAKLQRTPHWLAEEDFKAIGAFYTESRRLTEETGIPHHVDHIIPLQGENVSGLHVPSNLQILTAPENSRKGTSYEKQEQAEAHKEGPQEDLQYL